MTHRPSQYEVLMAITPAKDTDFLDFLDPEDPLLTEYQADCDGDPPLTDFDRAATMLRESLRIIGEVCFTDRLAGMIVLWRMSGLSLAEIGARCRMSKQAVHKRIRIIAERWPMLSTAIDGDTPPYDPHAAGPLDTAKAAAKDAATRQSASAWMHRHRR